MITSNWANQAETLLNKNIDAYFALPAPRTDYQKSVALANFDSIWNFLVSQCRQVPGGAGQLAAGLRALLHADQGQIDEPRLRRDESLDLRAHRARIEVVNDEEPGRIVDQPLMGLAIGG